MKHMALLTRNKHSSRHLKWSSISPEEEAIDASKSNELAKGLRQMYNLPPIKGELRTDVVRDLAGLLESYVRGKSCGCDQRYFQ
jgi:hypothetical protein